MRYCCACPDVNNYSGRLYFFIDHQRIKEFFTFHWRSQDVHPSSRPQILNYRPQQSWGKVMFLQASVILLTGGGGSASVHAGIPPPPGADTPTKTRRPPLKEKTPSPGAEHAGRHGQRAGGNSYWNAILFPWGFPKKWPENSLPSASRPGTSFMRNPGPSIANQFYIKMCDYSPNVKIENNIVSFN